MTSESLPERLPCWKLCKQVARASAVGGHDGPALRFLAARIPGMGDLQTGGREPEGYEAEASTLTVRGMSPTGRHG